MVKYTAGKMRGVEHLDYYITDTLSVVNRSLSIGSDPIEPSGGLVTVSKI